MTAPPAMLATGFIADQPGEGSRFPSAGGRSDQLSVQAVYWRCIVVFFASARLFNPDLRLALFTNARPPAHDGVDFAEVLDGYGVELHLVPLRHRLPASRTPDWGNVLYFMDVLASLDGEDGALRLALMDCDILLRGPAAPLFALLDEADFAAYREDSPPGLDINGMSRLEMTEHALGLHGGARSVPVPHLGGELLACSLAAWRKVQPRFEQLFAEACARQSGSNALRTEEHFYSILLADPAIRLALANPVLRRIWTSPAFDTACPSDLELIFWHLPAEKRYGFRDLFDELRRSGFSARIEPDEFRRLAARHCGIPRRTMAKNLRDWARRIKARLARV